ncbi:NUDIX hydrolase [Nonomuraea sp. NPDC050556]|uniref:NUDIX hydrolase n=1 Tax=Nonomuraea sp. NPDC050556 TaxID=3364369 RepID=UPI003789835F
MSSDRPRHAVRAIVLDEDDRILLCRLAIGDLIVWVTPGGGIEPGESPMAALQRELREEIGLAVPPDPPHVWHQRVDAVINDYYLIRIPAFHPSGTMSDEQLRAEHITAFHWWPLPDIAAYTGPEIFSPRDLATPLTTLITTGPPATPVALGM